MAICRCSSPEAIAFSSLHTRLISEEPGRSLACMVASPLAACAVSNSVRLTECLSLAGQKDVPLWWMFGCLFAEYCILLLFVFFSLACEIGPYCLEMEQREGD